MFAVQSHGHVPAIRIIFLYSLTPAPARNVTRRLYQILLHSNTLLNTGRETDSWPLAQSVKSRVPLLPSRAPKISSEYFVLLTHDKHAAASENRPVLGPLNLRRHRVSLGIRYRDRHRWHFPRTRERRRFIRIDERCPGRQTCPSEGSRRGPGLTLIDRIRLLRFAPAHDQDRALRVTEYLHRVAARP